MIHCMECKSAHRMAARPSVLTSEENSSSDPLKNVMRRLAKGQPLGPPCRILTRISKEAALVLGHPFAAAQSTLDTLPNVPLVPPPRESLSCLAYEFTTIAMIPEIWSTMSSRCCRVGWDVGEGRGAIPKWGGRGRRKKRRRSGIAIGASHRWKTVGDRRDSSKKEAAPGGVFAPNVDSERAKA